MKGIFRMQSRSENRKKKQEKQRIILGIIILILAILITIITASIISKNTAKEVATKEPESLADEFVNSVNTQNFEEDVNEEIIENSVEENEVVENTVTEENKNTSGTKYRLEVNCKQNVVNVYEKDENGEYKNCVKVMLCSVGFATPTSGTYSLKKYGGWEWKGLQGDVYGQYATQITGNILFHSVPYTEKYNNASLEYWEYDKLGTSASLGCIRLTVKNAKWIYDNCAAGTKVYFYKDSNPGPLGKPSERKISGDSEVNSWDPTDPASDNPWKEYDIAKKNDKENTESNKNNNIENKIENNVQNTEQNTEVPGNTENTETNTEKVNNTENTTNNELINTEIVNKETINDISE
jgi:lipoprotein-anchoring transpeptidase ErfK/SrfK